jgi:hypothetical protein
MYGKKSFSFCLLVAALGFSLLLLPFFAVSPAQAGSLTQDIDNGNCIKCHEDLYFLHDTGNYFCIRESPMRCVDCHGGDPVATTQETAHFDRSAHPIVNEDISKCQECHTEEEECCECISKFDQLAGIKEVKLVSPVPVSSVPNQTTGLTPFEEQDPFSGLLTLEILPLFVIISIALTIYILHKARHS